MKKITLFSILSCLTAIVFAQPVLTWVRPPYGTTKTYNIYTGTMTEPSIGANQIWDYSALTTGSIGAGVYTDPLTLPPSVINKFPTATYVEVWTSPAAPTVEQAIVDFYHDYPDSLVRMGQQSSGGSNYSTWGDVEGVWNIPFGGSTNANYMDPMTGQLVSGSFSYAAYGTLTTPFGTYNDVVMITLPGVKNFFTTTPYFGKLMKIVYSGPTTIAGAYIYSYGTSSGIDDVKNEQTINIYPNPVSEDLLIDFLESKIIRVEILNVLGEAILIQEISSSTLKINTVELSKGIYFIKTMDENNNISTSKFIKN